MRDFCIGFDKYPFEKLNILLKNIKPNKKYKEANLTIGEPSFKTSAFIQEAFKNSSELLRKYPKSAGEPDLKESIISFVATRFNINLKDSEIIPTLGTREVLFNFPQFLSFNIKNPFFAFTNPFYQIYEGASICSRAKIKYIDLNEQNNFTPSLDIDTLKKIDFVIINFPNNPTTKTLTLNELTDWVKLAIKYDFVLLNDECYSEIYFNAPPVSLLQASILANNHSFKNILVVNSLSKRSSAPSLRSGFIAGDENILKEYSKYRTYLGTSMPTPLQIASCVAWRDEVHVKKNREKYKQNFLLAKNILKIKIPQATFYIWMKIEDNDDINFTTKLYKETNIKVLPGSFLGKNKVGDGYIRIALVQNIDDTKNTLTLLKNFINRYYLNSTKPS